MWCDAPRCVDSCLSGSAVVVKETQASMTVAHTDVVTRRSGLCRPAVGH